jgi:peptidoglycan hydrolase CwlO-like protein
VNAATEAKQAQLKIKHLTSELKEHKKLVQSAGKEYTSLQSEISAANKDLAQLKVTSP